ncbi:hypothetical protein J8J04_01840 ['Fragaria x ananassa' phyllody phytoplasma]|uniref:Uncharacterized protein n=1 Tax='Fragaria x ananassa' phyllody phytoplasma TaxID=2358428 RepID=A0ABS5K3D9_9MOLU|nr:hypothetical protein ['Fragaria x ananassa' phyllody phytoplasma]MBS2126424.1 hypothetical protein ['Fragaria x ananassa' phyllody phytoplasma]
MVFAKIFAPGTPQVCYVGLFLDGINDIEVLESSKAGCNINHHYYFRQGKLSKS